MKIFLNTTGDFCKWLILIALCLIRGLCIQHVILTPEVAEVIENGSITLTCSYDSRETVTSSRWIYSAASTNPVIVQVDDACVAAGFLNNTTSYGWECHGNNSFSLTLKKVGRQNHGETWSCRQSNIGSNTVSIYVKVPVNKAEIKTPERKVTTLSENTNETFICTASPARPMTTITWFLDKGTTQSDKVKILNHATQSNTTNNEGLIYATGMLVYAPAREENGLSLYCIASNLPNQEVESNRVLLNVTYSPESPPRIQGFQNGSIYQVIEHTIGQLSCSVTGGNPLASIIWECFNNTWDVSTDGKTVTANVTWTASRNRTGSCICLSKHIESSEKLVFVNIDVLYPPSRPSIKVNNVTVPSAENIRVMRNNTLHLSCNSSSKSSPTFDWTFPDGTASSGQTLNIVNIQTSNEGRYFCTAENEMNASSGDIATGTSVSYVEIKVLYPPTTPVFRYGNITGPLISNLYVDVVLGDTFTIACVSNGKPEPNYRWSNQTIKSQLLTITSITVDLARTCISANMMNETVGENRGGQAEAKLSVYILYPPNAPIILLHNDVSNYVHVSDSIKVIEGSPFTLTCNAISKPNSSYSWKGPLMSTSSELTIQNIKRAQKGRYSCLVFNTMKRSFGDTEIGENNTSVDIDILYTPGIESLQNQTVIEGAFLNKTCPVIQGNPSFLAVHWTRNGDDRLWHGEQLIILTVFRNDSMTYTCTVNYTMEPTVGDKTEGRMSKYFHLDVLYKASIVDFFLNGYYEQNPVTIDENMTVEFRCNIDSNPKSTITISFMEHILTTTKENALALVYMRQSAGCLHTGAYICTGMNEYNHGEPSKKSVTLNVKCFPRPSPNIKIRDVIFTAEHVSVSLNFTALAYPVPAISGYKWRKYVGSVWIPLATSDNIVIDTSGLQSNLTIRNVGQSDYGTYRLEIENSIGIFEQMFKVGPEEKPYPPTDFEHVEDLNTESSFTVRWKPGLNGGPTQTFILSYKKTSVQTWVNISIPDNGEEFMHYTLSGLTSGSYYEVIIYSVNKLGRSADSDELRIKTKEIPSAQTELPVTYIILGTLAALVLMVTLVVLATIFVRRRQLTSRTRENRRKYKRKYDRFDGRLNKRHTTTKLIEYENVEEHKKDCSGVALRKTTHNSAIKTTEPVYEEINHEDERSKSQLQQYVLISKGKGSVHIYEDIDALTKCQVRYVKDDNVKVDVDMRQSHMYEAIEPVKGPIRYVKSKTAVGKNTDNTTSQTRKKRTNNGITCTGEHYENMHI